METANRIIRAVLAVGVSPEWINSLYYRLECRKDNLYIFSCLMGAIGVRYITADAVDILIEEFSYGVLLDTVLALNHKAENALSKMRMESQFNATK